MNKNPIIADLLQQLNICADSKALFLLPTTCRWLLPNIRKMLAQSRRTWNDGRIDVNNSNSRVQQKIPKRLQQVYQSTRNPQAISVPALSLLQDVCYAFQAENCTLSTESLRTTPRICTIHIVISFGRCKSQFCINSLYLSNLHRHTLGYAAVAQRRGRQRDGRPGRKVRSEKIKSPKK